MSSKMKSSTETGSGTDLVPKLRFPEFRDAAGWESGKVDDLVDTVTPFKRLQTSEYKPEGKFPIIDQSSNFICGWTNDGEAVVEKGLPVIVFGDHTCALKFVDRPFVQGADGIKIIRPNRAIDARFFFNALEADPVTQDGYKRHFSVLREKKLPFPDFATGEQQKIADCLGSVDALIVAQGQKVEALRAHKKGLMQQLFPQEGETQPRLRFPEFEEAGEWSLAPLGELGDIITGKTPSTSESDLWGGDILFITPTDISDHGKYQRTTTRTVVKTKNMTVLPAGSVAYTCIASIGKMAITVRPSVTNQQINAVIPNERAPVEFIYYALENLTPWIKTIPASNTLPIINKTEFSKISIPYSKNKAEQQRIADCLTSLDDLIAAETRKLDTTKTHKKGLMQQLFPQVAEDDA